MVARTGFHIREEVIIYIMLISCNDLMKSIQLESSTVSLLSPGLCSL